MKSVEQTSNKPVLKDESGGPEAEDQPFRIGEWRVEPQLHRLVRGDETVQLAPKFIQVLTYLARSPGDVVSRDELMAEVWPDVVVGEAVLTRAVSELRRTLGDDQRSPRYIETIVKGGYRLLTPVERIVERAEADAPARRLPAAVVFALAAAVGFGLVWIRAAEKSTDHTQPVEPGSSEAGPADEARIPLDARPLTAETGDEFSPALSPDGRWVAYVWRRDNRTVGDLMLRSLEGGEPRRLTDGETVRSPAFSPDGRHLAFLECAEGGTKLRIRDLDAPADEVHDETFAHVDEPRCGVGLAWSPDGTELAYEQAGGIVLRRRSTGETRRLPSPPNPSERDALPRFSPDGRRVAFLRGGTSGGRVMLVDLAEGQVRAVTQEPRSFDGLAWSPDGDELFFASGGILFWLDPQTGRSTEAWRGESYAGAPTLSTRGDLVFTRAAFDVNLWRMELDGETEDGEKEPAADVRPLLASTRIDGDPRISPDGRRVAFISNRAGDCALYVSDAAGQIPLALNGLPGDCMKMAEPAWSPDGRSLAYVAWRDGQADLEIVPSDGGPARRLTTHSSDDVTPAWSPDGESIYFASRRSGSWQVWQQSLVGEATQRTYGGGVTGRPSADGAWLLHVRPGHDGLWRLPLGQELEHAPPEQVIETFPRSAADWRVTSEGVVFLDRSKARPELRIVDDTRRTETLADLDPEHCVRLDVAPDLSWMVFARVDHGGSDLVHARLGSPRRSN